MAERVGDEGSLPSPLIVTTLDSSALARWARVIRSYWARYRDISRPSRHSDTKARRSSRAYGAAQRLELARDRYAALHRLQLRDTQDCVRIGSCHDALESRRRCCGGKGLSGSRAPPALAACAGLEVSGSPMLLGHEDAPH